MEVILSMRVHRHLCQAVMIPRHWGGAFGVQRLCRYRARVGRPLHSLAGTGKQSGRAATRLKELVLAIECFKKHPKWQLAEHTDTPCQPPPPPQQSCLLCCARESVNLRHSYWEKVSPKGLTHRWVK